MEGMRMNRMMMRMMNNLMMMILISSSSSYSNGIIVVGAEVSSNGNSNSKSMWCVARSDASDWELQRGLDYACAAGADCAPIKESGLCYLPNTLQAHASYAFNSFFHRSFMSPSSCDFSGTATLAMTDPSYGSCVYPASPSTAGAITSTTGATPTTNPNSVGNAMPFTPATTTTSPTTIYGGGGAVGGINPTNMGPPIPTTNDSKTSLPLSAASTPLFLLLQMSLFLLLKH